MYTMEISLNAMEQWNLRMTWFVTQNIQIYKTKYMQNSYLQLESPGIISAILVSGIGGTFQYGFHISVMTSPSLVSRINLKAQGKIAVDWTDLN